MVHVVYGGVRGVCHLIERYFNGVNKAAASHVSKSGRQAKLLGTQRGGRFGKGDSKLKRT